MADTSPIAGAPLDHVEVVASEGAALIAAMRQGEWDRTIPAIPRWNRLALAAHVGKVWHWAARIVSGRVQDYPGFDREPVLDPDSAVDHLESGLVAVMDALRTCPDDAAMWTLSGPGVGAFWKRRQAVETLVHRVDSQASLDEVGPLDPAMAADGVGEFFEVVLPLQARFKGTPTGALTARATDADLTWSVGDPATGSGELMGSAEQLLLGLWKRAPLADLRHAGDPAVIAGWMELGAL